MNLLAGRSDGEAFKVCVHDCLAASIKAYDTFSDGLTFKNDYAILSSEVGHEGSAKFWDRRVLAFRGSDDAMDWIKNIEAVPTWGPWPVPVHRGFANSALGLWAEFKKKHPEVLQRKGLLVLTGHSRGGALATLCGYLAIAEGFFPMVVTFGSPRVFSGWPLKEGLLIFRVENHYDPIPQLPETNGFYHVGEVLKVSSRQGWLERYFDWIWEVVGLRVKPDLAAHRIGAYIQALEDWRPAKAIL